MKQHFVCLVTVACLSAEPKISFGNAFTPGNLVVVRAGDGTALSYLDANAVFLEEFTVTGTPVQTLALPTSVSGSNRRLTMIRGGFQGFLSRSTDERYLLVGGYDAAVGTDNVQLTSSAAVNRVVGRIDDHGVIDTTTALADAYDGSLFRCVVSNDGTNLWLTGFASAANFASGGVRYANLGGVTSTRLTRTSFSIPLVAGIYEDQLYVTGGLGSFAGINAVGSGLPTTGGQTITNVVNTGTFEGNNSPLEFFFATADLLYISVGGSSPSPGIQRWTKTGGSWSMDYAFPSIGFQGYSSLTGAYDPGSNVTTLFATTFIDSNNQLISITDTGPNSAITVLAQSGQFSAFRGVAFAPIPEPSTLALLLAAAGLLLRRR